MPRTISERMSAALGIAEETMQDAQTRPPGKVVDITPASATTEIVPFAPVIAAGEEARIQETAADYTYARATIYELIEMGKQTLHRLIPFARDSQNARTYEVTHLLLKTTSEMAKDLLEVQQRMNSLEVSNPKEPVSSTVVNVQNNTFVGTTAELTRMAKQALLDAQIGEPPE